MLTEPFLVKRILNLETSAKRPYQIVDLVGIDKQKKHGVVWSPETVVEDDVLHENIVYIFDADETVYQGKEQLKIRTAVQVNDNNVDRSVYSEISQIPSDSLFIQLSELLSIIETPSYRTIIKSLLQNPDIEKKLKFLPKTLNYDYSYVGGLLSSLCHQVKIAIDISKTLLETQESRDLLVCGAFVCDIGKIIEIDLSHKLTVDGDLLGHQVTGCRMLDEIDKNFDYQFHAEILKLCHCILVHHTDDLGNWSPMKVKFKEADMLRMISNLVIKTAGWSL